jgi:3-mercaptopyruvate sulfurtransferase SseA
VEALAKAFGELGITAQSHVVLYTTAWPPTAARAWFTRYPWPADRAALLDGASSSGSPRNAR